MATLKAVLVAIAIVPFAAPCLTLESAVKNEWNRSSLIDGQKTQADLSSGDVWRRYLFNEPQFQYSSSDDSTAHSFGISLAVPFPGKSLAMQKIDRAREFSQHSELSAKRYDVAKSVTQAYLDCAVGQNQVKLQLINIGDLETLSNTLKRLYESGHSTQAEKISTELQLRQRQADLEGFQDHTKVFCQKLARMLNIDTSEIEALPLLDDLGEEVFANLRETSDELRSHAAVEQADATSTTAWWTQFPDFTLSASRNHYVYLPGSPSGKEWTTTYGVSVTLPILFAFEETAEAKRAKSQAIMDRSTAEVQIINATSDVEDAAREYRRSVNRLNELRKTDLRLAEALVESALSAYRLGRLGFADLTLSRKTLSDLKAQDIQLRASIISAHLRCVGRCSTTKNQKDSSL